jgi:dipeptidyl aminopeptidase/acylaminoacyl peptidase
MNQTDTLVHMQHRQQFLLSSVLLVPYSLRSCLHTCLWSLLLFVCIVLGSLAESIAQGKRAMTFDDAMKFRAIEAVSLAPNGSWLGYVERPDRGDPVLRLHSLQKSAPAALAKPQYSIERGSRVQFSRDGAWAAVTVAPKYLVAEKSKPDNRPDNALTLLQTSTGKQTTFANVSRFALSENGQWIAILFTKNRKEFTDRTSIQDSATKKVPTKPAAESKDKKPEAGTMLLLRRTDGSSETFIPFVKEFAFDSLATTLAVTTLDTAMRGTLSVCNLATLASSASGSASGNSPSTSIIMLDSMRYGVYTHPTWHRTNGSLAYCSAQVSTTNIVSAAALKLTRRDAATATWSTPQTLVQSAEHAEGLTQNQNQARTQQPLLKTPARWVIPSKNTLSWSFDGAALLFGMKPSEIHEALSSKEPDANADTLDADLYNPNKILKTAEVDVWKWDDDYTNIHQKKRWETVKDQTYLAVYTLTSQNYTLVASRDMPSVVMPLASNASVALGRRDAPYRKEITWDDSYFDLMAVSLTSGSAQRVAEHIQYESLISPHGKYILYYRDKHWFLYDIAAGTTRNLTDKLGVAFWDEQDDHPAAKPSYGFAGWVVDGSNDVAVLLNDQYDVWYVPTTAAGNTAIGTVLNLTGGFGRKQECALRVIQLDSAKRFFQRGESVLLLGEYDRTKHSAVFAATIGTSGIKKLLEDTKRKYSGFVKAESAPTIVFRQMDYNVFPDLWLTDTTLAAPKRITDLQKQVEQFAWGSAELVEWLSTDGKPLQGVLIKPGSYERGKRYPVLVYFYELMSDRLHDFAMPAVGSRPAFGLYASNGYALFLPDVRYTDGLPGASAMKCILPGIQKIIDMGIADPLNIGIQGHSWGGYQTMYMLTQTSLFKAAAAGAAVANMTSAYGGIRYGSGLARMFQYERSQSRIGATLWERRDLYIDNSPLFFADRISTATLMMFGDDDDAVPWTQGIEMYLAMRRLGKEAYFLQYRKEPHHPRKYANRYDYAVKMKEFFDTYLKGAPAPEWMKAGVPYRGR